jgi:tetratricopeptide (TPR) repeat protein
MRLRPALLPRSRFLLLCSLLSALAPCLAAQQAAPAALPPITATMKSDPLTRSAFDHYYNLEYDQAVKEFERALEQHPQDPFAVNHLINALMFRELYRTGALDTSLYANNSFIDKKTYPVDPQVKQRLQELTQRALQLEESRLKADPDDVNTLYARGTTLGLRATYIGLVDKAWYSALRSALAARHDQERVLQLDPSYADAKTLVGTHNYVIAGLPWMIKVAAAVVGVSGNRKKGLEQLQEAAAAGGETAVDANVILGLFYRREQKYDLALQRVRGLIAAHPKNFLFLLEEANLLNAAGHGQEAIAAYRRIVQQGKDGYFTDPHLELAAFGLGEALRGQRQYQDALAAYESVNQYPHRDPELRQKADLSAGEMDDVLQKRDLALAKYKNVIAQNSSTPEADLARKHLKQPYRMP